METYRPNYMTSEQAKSYETYTGAGYEYDWTDGDGRIVLSRWNNTAETRWKTAQVRIDLDGGVSAFSGA